MRGGVCQSYHELVLSLHKLADVRYISRYSGLPDSVARRSLGSDIAGKTFRKALKIYFLIKLMLTCARAQKARGVLLCSDYSLFWLLGIVPIKSIVTIHDTIDEFMQRERILTPGIRKAIDRKIACVRHSDAIVFVSAATKHAFISIYGSEMLSGKIVRVVHHSPRQAVVAGIEAAELKTPTKGNNKKSVLFIGERSGYKNFSVLIDALALMSKRKYVLEFVIVGRALDPNEKASLRDLKRHGVTITHIADISDYQLGMLYRQVGAFCYPSSMESFGLPVLEALVTGISVVCRDLPCIREFASEYPYYWDGSNAKTLAETIERAFLERACKRTPTETRPPIVRKNTMDVANKYLAIATSLLER